MSAMEFVFEIILQFLGEIILQMFFEILAEIGLRSLMDIFKRQKNPILSTIGFVLLGSIAGGISLLIFPNSAIHKPVMRMINLVITPVVAGGFMMLVGRERGKRGQSLVRLDRFGYAFVFALAMAAVRYIWAE